MLTYNLINIAPEGGQFATTTLGMLLCLMELGLVLWFVIAIVINT